MSHSDLRSFFAALSLVAGATTPALAQSSHAASAARAADSVASRFDRWTAQYGPNWRMDLDAETGYAQMIYGGKARAFVRPKVDADFERLAEQRLSETIALHGIELESLVRETVVFLPLGMIGSTDKVTVRYRQEVGGLHVVGGFVNVLFNADGDLLSIQSTGLPHALGIDTRTAQFAGQASARAAGAFASDTGLEPTSIGDAVLVIESVRAGGTRSPRLAWQVDVLWEAEDTQPEGFRYWIDAQTGGVLRREATVHTFDVTGTVTTRATPGVLPDTGANPETTQTAKYLRVTSSQGTVYTDANGNFNYPGVNVPLAVTVTYGGTFNNVTNQATGGSNYSLTQTIQPNTPTTLLMNPSATDTVTSQANAFQGVNILRDWVRSVNPLDVRADFVARAKVNQASTCNAFYNGNSLNFFASGGGCVNTAYSTVISHEHGHWMNDLYSTGNGSDGMGEGNADVWAMYIWDNPIVGQNFAGSGNHIRTGTNTVPYCGDGNGGCYGEVHADGQVWMGAAWKIRSRLNTTHGNATGDAIANSLFLAWMNSYDQTAIQSLIETQWLTLDDNDGNINSGTPHFADIDLAFRDQGFPGVVPQPITFSNVTDHYDTENEAGPYGINATIFANQTGPITSATLRYRVNGGSFVDVPMHLFGNNIWQGLIPGHLAHAHLEYYVAAADAGAHTATFPRYAPTQLLEFDIAIVHPLAFYNFDAANDQGWTHGTVGGASNPEDDWVRHVPIGKAGVSGGINWADPPVSASPNRCWGNDLGLLGSDGAYGANVHNYLRSPLIDCTGAVGTKLRFKRWLSVQGSAGDQARILVNGTQVFVNSAANLVDTGWVNQEIDISAIADNNPAVQVEWRLQSNGSTQTGGWNIDDVYLVWIELPACGTAVNYCNNTPNSFDPNGAIMGFSGSTSLASNDLVLVCSGVPPGSSGFFYFGREPDETPFGSNFLCVAAPSFRRPLVRADSFGVARSPLNYSGPLGARRLQSVSLPEPAFSAGESWYFQFYYLDPPAGPTSNRSDGLALRFCP